MFYALGSFSLSLSLSLSRERERLMKTDFLSLPLFRSLALKNLSTETSTTLLPLLFWIIKEEGDKKRSRTPKKKRKNGLLALEAQLALLNSFKEYEA